MHKNQLKKELDRMLWIWAEWALEGVETIGYPKKSIMSLIQEGSSIQKISPHCRLPIKENLMAEEIETWLKDLHSYNSDLSNAIRAKYLSPYYITSIKLAEKLGISRNRFDKRVSKAKLYLIEKLLDKLRTKCS